MASPMMNEVLPDLLEEMVYLLKQQGADPLESKLRALRIESVCDCGDENCASFATAAEVKVANYVELQSTEGQVIIDLNADDEICFIEVLGRPDVKYLLEEFYAAESYPAARWFCRTPPPKRSTNSVTSAATRSFSLSTVITW